MTTATPPLEKPADPALPVIQERPGTGCAHGGRWMVDIRSGRVMRQPCPGCCETGGRDEAPPRT